MVICGWRRENCVVGRRVRSASCSSRASSKCSAAGRAGGLMRHVSSWCGRSVRRVDHPNKQSNRRSHQALLDNGAMPLTRITLRQLEAYAAVAELLNFHAAAERLGLTAQAVSQLVAELEAVLGFRLFDRTTRRVALSSAGRDYLASAETVLRHVRAAESTAADVRHRATGVVRVGAPLVLAA